MTNGVALETDPGQSPRRPVIGIVLYPNVTLIDLANPQAALHPFCDTHLLWKTLDPVPTDAGYSVVPTATFAECPERLDALLVPGGLGTNDAMQDDEILAFLKCRGADASYITSVCSGSLILGAAGLLDGYKAATHWAFYDALKAMNVESVHERVVKDGNRITGGGVTAGLDFGLTLLAKLAGEGTARLAQLLLEYDPQPPYNSGNPYDG
jgi:cyclohexyl-isocyanide hydratase